MHLCTVWHAMVVVVVAVMLVDSLLVLLLELGSDLLSNLLQWGSVQGGQAIRYTIQSIWRQFCVAW